MIFSIGYKDSIIQNELDNKPLPISTQNIWNILNSLNFLKK